ncbi:hypothetical protein OCU04_008633 [Sclerotinia nivalis]|uniref:Uncharacterized protein n=1 Tax=Sclerotinia nivalis TaxID=352851 RepID=A0A9X0AJI7_9HELO|nr:hypothetical protein OCU04_008633 [Sclerotinia nivalis]
MHKCATSKSGGEHVKHIGHRAFNNSRIVEYRQTQIKPVSLGESSNSLYPDNPFDEPFDDRYMPLEKPQVSFPGSAVASKLSLHREYSSRDSVSVGRAPSPSAGKKYITESGEEIEDEIGSEGSAEPSGDDEYQRAPAPRARQARAKNKRQKINPYPGAEEKLVNDGKRSGRRALSLIEWFKATTIPAFPLSVCNRQ